MKHQNIICAALLAIGIFCAGLALRNGIITFKDRDRTVSVKGLAEREVKADLVKWPLVYKEMGNDPSVMYETLKKKNETIVKFLKDGGLTDDEISVNPPEITDRQANDYNNGNVDRYKATGIVTVTSKNIDKVRALMDRQGELMTMGIPIIHEEWSNNTVSYDFTGLNKIKPEMVEEATKNARSTAEKFAKDSKSKVGKINSAYQGIFEISDRDENTPYIKNVRVVITMDYQLED